MGPVLATGFGFSTGIQNQLAVLYCLGSAQSEGKMRADLSWTYGEKGCTPQTQLHFVFSLYGTICHNKLDRSVTELVPSTLTAEVAAMNAGTEPNMPVR